MDPRPDDPATVGRYRVLAHLGDGELGRLLLGVDEADRRAAVRLVDADLAVAPGFRDRFRQEIRSAAGAPAWFVAAVLDADPEADRPWLATTLVEGPTLHDFVTANGPLGGQGTTALAVRTADGLVALHHSGLAHRDLVPANVVLAEDGPRLINFGVRRAADPVWLARTGHVAGPPGFLAPELATSGDDPGLPGDVFAWGAMVVFAATGRSPFAAATPAEVLERLRAGEPDPGPLPAPLREAVLASLAKDPAARPTAAHLRDLLAGSADAAAVTEAIPMNARDTVIGPPVPPPPDAPHATRAFAAPPAPPPHGAGFGSAPPGPAAYGGPQLYGSGHPEVPPAGPAASGGWLRRWWPVLLAAVAGAAVAVVALVALGGGFGGTADPDAPPPGTAGGPTGDPTGDPTDAPPGTTAAAPAEPPPGITTIVDSATDDRFGSDPVRFATPSGNIACALSGDETRCDVLENSWALPPTPADCRQAFGSGTRLVGDRPGELSCVGDTVAEPGLPVLEYGTAVRRDGVLCASRETGLRCEDERTGHGFEVARAAYELF